MKILVYPIGKNPYQTLLYNELIKHEVIKIKYVNNDYIDTKHAFTIGMFFFPFRFLFYRIMGWNIIHLHWLSPFILPSKNTITKYISALYIIIFLVYTKLLRFKLVWTLHEVLPHKKEFFNDRFVRAIVTIFSNAKIVHSPTALTEAKNLGYNINNTFVIPHGNYHLIYKNTIPRDKARKKLQINNNDFVILFFGMIKPYKGIDSLLEAYEVILKENQKTKLVIAGNSSDMQINNLLTKFANRYKQNVLLNLAHIEDEDVQYYFNACDIVALPFKENTTSGSAILALSFAKPIIAPLIGSFNDLPKKVGYFYNHTDKEGLQKCIRQALKDRVNLPKLGSNGFSYSKKLTWDKISSLTMSVFQKI